jgi:hypothetical protein
MHVPGPVRIAAFAALIVADIVLVVYVLKGGSLASAPPPVRAETSTSTSTPSVSTTRPTSTATGGTEVTGPRAVSVVDATTAFRAARAGCSTSGPGLQKSTDGGRTWTATAQPPVGSVTRIEFTSTARGYIVATRKGDCRLEVRTTGDGGNSWSDPIGADTYWSPLPGSPAKVNTATGQDVTPCPSGDVVQLARVTDNRAVALCSKGVVRVTVDGGATWTSQATVTGATTLTVDRSTQNRLVLAGRDADCPGARVWTLGADADRPTVAACVPMPAKDVGSASLAAAAKGGATWLVTGASAWTSAGGLSTWSSA